MNYNSFHYAARNNQLEVVIFLHEKYMEKRHLPNLNNYDSRTNAVVYGCDDICIRHNSPIINAARNGNLDMVKYLYEHGADITAQNNEAITLAFKYGHVEVVAFLKENGARQCV